MREAADAIIEYTRRGREAFDGDAALRDAILYQIIVIGEAAKAAVNADPSIESTLPLRERSCGTLSRCPSARFSMSISRT